MKSPGYLFIILFFLVSYPLLAQIDLLWSANSYITDLYRYSDGRVEYYCQKVSTAMNVYDSDSFELQYSVPCNADDMAYRLLPDINSNGYEEIVIVGANTFGKYIVKIVDLGTGAIIYSWSEDGANYYFRNLHQSINSNELRIDIYKEVNGYIVGESIYTLGISPNNIQDPFNGISDRNYKLVQNYPNPFNVNTIISYEINTPGNVTIKIYDITGGLVKQFLLSHSASGTYKINWDGTDNNGGKVVTGTYLYTFESGGNLSAKKMILLK